MVNIDLNMEPKENGEDEAKEISSMKPRNRIWTIHETMVMLRGKYAVENSETGAWRSRVPAVMSEKWPLVSAYCEGHGVRRTPEECKDRWERLYVRFRQIRAWEETAVREGDGDDGGAAAAAGESYWEMSNTRRGEMEIPREFNREIYEFLSKMEPEQGDDVVEVLDDDDFNGGDEEEVEDNGEVKKEELETGSEFGNNDPIDVEKIVEEDTKKSVNEGTSAGAGLKRKADHPSRVPVELVSSDEETISANVGGEKRRPRLTINHSEDQNLRTQIIDAMESNSKILKAHCEACKEDREERNKQTNSIIAVLSKMTDAITKIAEKL